MLTNTSKLTVNLSRVTLLGWHDNPQYSYLHWYARDLKMKPRFWTCKQYLEPGMWQWCRLSVCHQDNSWHFFIMQYITLSFYQLYIFYFSFTTTLYSFALRQYFIWQKVMHRIWKIKQFRSIAKIWHTDTIIGLNLPVINGKDPHNNKK